MIHLQYSICDVLIGLLPFVLAINIWTTCCIGKCLQQTKNCKGTDQNGNVLMMQTLALNQTCPLGDERPHI